MSEKNSRRGSRGNEALTEKPGADQSLLTSAAKKSWTGFLRPDGRKGIRNLVLVIYTVECAQHVAHNIAAGEEDVHVIGFPGCYDNAYAIRLMLALARHPNVGALLSVGLGCPLTTGISRTNAAPPRLEVW